MVSEPVDYRWRSYPAFIGKANRPEWLDAGLLAFFGKRKKQAEKNYQSFVEEVNLNDIVKSIGMAKQISARHRKV